MGIKVSKEFEAELLARGAIVGPKAALPKADKTEPVRSNGVLSLMIPLWLASLNNMRDPFKVMKIKGEQKNIVGYSLYVAAVEQKIIPDLPATITICRVGPRTLDGDNLQGACKYVRDAIAAFLGVDDADERLTWVYEQQKGKYRVDISIKSV